MNASLRLEWINYATSAMLQDHWYVIVVIVKGQGPGTSHALQSKAYSCGKKIHNELNLVSTASYYTQGRQGRSAQ
eukprot:9604-Heterococcus_DN1.PRE.6